MRLAIRWLIRLGFLLALAVPAGAQPGKKPQIGWLGPGSSESNFGNRKAFLDGMRSLGYEEGRDFVLEARFWGSDERALANAVHALVGLNVDVIVTPGTLAVRLVQAATDKIPIVMTAVGDPVASGLVVSLSNPGFKTTGLTILSKELAAKRLELLKEALPTVRRIAVMQNPSNPVHAQTIRDVEAAALPLDLVLGTFDAGAPETFARTIAAMVEWSADAGLILDEGIFVSNRTHLTALALERRLPLSCGFHEMTAAGCLLSYSVNLRDINFRAASYVVKILRGANAEELPIEQPSKFDLVINLQVAKILKITIPESLLARADEVIE